MHKWTEEQLAKGYIKPSKSPYAASTFCIKKKNGSYCPVQDYRPVNYWTIRDQYPIPDIKHITKELQGHTLFTKFNIRSGYNNVHIRVGDKWKAAFCMAEGHWQPKVMYFGQCNTPPTFQQIVNKLLQPLKNKYPGMIHAYMDDILISMPNNLTLHRRIVHDVLDALEAASFYLQVTKCVFEATRIECLGLLIDGNTLKINPTKQKGIAEWPKKLTTLKQVRQFLGVVGYHRPWIEGFAHIARPLTNLQKKDVPFIWDNKCKTAVQTLKHHVTSNPVLWQPDHNRPFILEVDASQYATSAILWQEDNKGKKHAIGYDSSTLSDAERNYPIYDRELLAMIHGLENWRYLLAGTKTPIQVLSDHKNLTYWKDGHNIG